MIWRVLSSLAVGFFAAWLGVMVSDYEVPVVVLDMKPHRAQVKAGDVFRAHYKFFRKRSCTTHVDRFIYDDEGQRFVIPPLDFVVGSLPLGEDVASVPATVPRDASPGPASYTTVNCYVCNPLHKVWPVCDNPRTIRFVILPP